MILQFFAGLPRLRLVSDKTLGVIASRRRGNPELKNRKSLFA